MKERLSLIPTALQHQLMIQVVLILLNIFLAFITLFAFSAAVSIPFLMLSLLLAGSIIRLYLIGVQGHYLILHGVILKVERTPIRQRPKALLLEAEGKALRLVLRNRHISPSEGHTVVLYLADTTPIYERRGIHQLHSYLALALPKQNVGQRKPK